MRSRLQVVVWGVVVATLALAVDAAKRAPNAFLGKCLDDKWVKQVEAQSNISSVARDALHRLLEPHLHAAIKARRFAIDDPRINNKALDQIFTKSCTKTPFTFWGVGAEVDAMTGTVTAPGFVNGSLVVEYKSWASSQLTTMVFAILTKEILGYDVSFYSSPNSAEMGARMTNSGEGVCTPVHVNLEEWGRKYPSFMNEIYKTGSHSYVGRSGLYTTTKFVDTGLNKTLNNPVFNADFYRDYANSDGLIAALDADLIFKNSKYYPIIPPACADGIMGCKDGCSRTDTCTTREQKNGKCLAVALMTPSYDDGRTEATLANNKVPSYHCFLGYNGVENYAVEMEAKNVPVAFYHYEPDPFHFIHRNKFRRIFLPRAEPGLAALSTATFGENGYGKPTNNPLSVDFPITTLNRYASLLIQNHPPVAALMSRMALTELDMSTLLETYVGITYMGEAAIEPDDPVYSAACEWVRDNYMTWRFWLDRLPQCSLMEHSTFSLHHCNDTQPQEVHFAWVMPHPLDPSKPFACDGGQNVLPSVLKTSKSCAWLTANTYSWIGGAIELPVCDSSFYSFRVSDCDTDSKRTATYYWLVPDPADETKSLECRDIDTFSLPEPVEFACGYAPFKAPIPTIVMIVAAVLATVLLGMMGFVIRYRREPIIKRSQFEFLLTMLTGGIAMCGAAVVYAGEPSYFLCGARPIVTSVGFTLIFGSLVVKSLRVYRVFMSKAMKRVVLSTSTMLKTLGLFLAVDIAILVAWFVIDFPDPTFKPKTVSALDGASYDFKVSASSSFIFTALLLFWKAIVLFAGLYLSFLIRNVSTDFQESIWIFASSLVVLLASIVILPMTYLVELPADVFYAFLAFMLLGCTAVVMGMMLIPKTRRLHAEPSDMTNREATGENSSQHTSEGTSNNGKVSKVRFGSKAQVSVTPVEAFVPKSKPYDQAGSGASDASDGQ